MGRSLLWTKSEGGCVATLASLFAS